MATKLDLINELVSKTRLGDQTACSELLHLFMPLIYKTSRRIHYRYGSIFTKEEIIKQARIALIHLTLVTYTPHGKAEYPYFIKQSLHAYLVNIYRPIWYLAGRSTSIENLIEEPTRQDTLIEKEERHQICLNILNYVQEKCSEREKLLVNEILLKGKSRYLMATELGISKTRIKVLYRKLIKKLHYFVVNLGVNNIEEI